MRGLALLVVLATSLMLAGCGSSRATPPIGAALAAKIRSGGAFLEAGSDVSCVGHACTIAWRGRVPNARVGWITAFGVLWSIQTDSDFRPVRDLSVKVSDTRSQRVSIFRCNRRHKLNLPPSGSMDSLTSSPSDLGCVETERMRA